MEKFILLKVAGITGPYPDENGEKVAFRLTYDYDLIVEAESATGYNLLQALTNPERMSAGQLGAMAFGLLKKAHPEVTRKEVGQLLTADSEAVMDAVLQALEMPTSDEALFRVLSRVAVERPVVLVEMLARIRPMLPAEPPKPESVEADTQA